MATAVRPNDTSPAQATALPVRLLLHPHCERNRSMVLYAERLAQYAPPGTTWTVDRVPELPVPFSARLSELLVPPIWLPRHTDGIVHVVDHAHSRYLRYLSCPTVVTVHDLIPLKAVRGDYPAAAGQNIPRRVGWWFRRNIEELPRARILVTPSQSTADELLRIQGPLEVPIEVVPHGIDREFIEGPSPEARAAMHDKLGALTERRILLQVTNGTFYKNDPAFMATFLELAERDTEWAWVRLGAPPKQHELAELSRRGLTDRFLHVSGSTNEVAALYEQADLLLFPSWDEGFGWPPLEAMSRGCPVACSDRGALAEIAAPGALVIPPDDPAEIVRRVCALFGSTEELSARIEAGRLHSEAFRWSNAVATMDQIYRRAAEI